MIKYLAHIALAVILTACSNPRETILPTKVSDMESIQSSIDRLNPEDAKLFAQFTERIAWIEEENRKSGLYFDTIEPGTTIADAIKNQVNFIEQKRQEEEEKRRKTREREETLAKMRESVTVIPTSLTIEKINYSSGFEAEFLRLALGFTNNTATPIIGIKGHIEITDVFDQTISLFETSTDHTISPGETYTEPPKLHGAAAYKLSNKTKLSNLSAEKLKTIWTPELIVFSDGKKIKKD